MYNLIFVDDEEYTRTIFRDLLDWESLDLNVSAVFSNGADALEYIKSYQVDVVLTDIMMPEFSGIDLAEAISQKWPDIVIVFISGYSEFEYAHKAIKYNVFDYILKPITYSALYETFCRVSVHLSKSKESDFVSDDLILKRQQLFSTFVFGDSYDTKLLSENLKDVAIHIDAEAAKTAVVNVKFRNFDEYIRKHWNNRKERFDIALGNITQDENKNAYAVPFVYAFGYMMIFIIDKAVSGDFDSYVSAYFKELKSKLETIFLLETDAYQIKFFSGFSKVKFYTFADAEREKSLSHQPKGFYDALIDKAKLFVVENLGKNISQNDVAQYLQINVSGFRKVFKEVTGQKFIEYLIEMRVEKSKELLADTTLKIGEICTMVGYRTTDHFQRVFKNHVGCSPSEYRKRVRGE